MSVYLADFKSTKYCFQNMIAPTANAYVAKLRFMLIQPCDVSPVAESWSISPVPLMQGALDL
jgi:hypothetical protein